METLRFGDGLAFRVALREALVPPRDADTPQLPETVFELRPGANAAPGEPTRLVAPPGPFLLYLALKLERDVTPEDLVAFRLSLWRSYTFRRDDGVTRGSLVARAEDLRFAAGMQTGEPRALHRARQHLDLLIDWLQTVRQQRGDAGDSVPSNFVCAVTDARADGELPDTLTAGGAERWHPFCFAMRSYHAARYVACRVGGRGKKTAVGGLFCTLVVPVQTAKGPRFVELEPGQNAVGVDAWLQSQLPVWGPSSEWTVTGSARFPDALVLGPVGAELVPAFREKMLQGVQRALDRAAPTKSAKRGAAALFEAWHTRVRALCAVDITAESPVAGEQAPRLPGAATLVCTLYRAVQRHELLPVGYKEEADVERPKKRSLRGEASDHGVQPDTERPAKRARADEEPELRQTAIAAFCIKRPSFPPPGPLNQPRPRSRERQKTIQDFFRAPADS